jgi:hypothetical protein
VDLEVELFAHAGVDDAAGSLRPDHEAADLLERILGRAQTDSLDGSTGGPFEPLERQRQVRTSLGRGDRVDLVDDAPSRALEQLLRAAGQHQVQRLRGGDEDVGRLAQHLLALALRGVSCAHGDAQIGADAAQGHAQVAVDVVGERLQRRNVDEVDALLGRPLLVRESVDRPQERGQRLARAGWGTDQDMLARGDRRPRLGLRGGRLLERIPEPVTGSPGETIQGHRSSVASGRSASDRIPHRRKTAKKSRSSGLR